MSSISSMVLVPPPEQQQDQRPYTSSFRAAEEHKLDNGSSTSSLDTASTGSSSTSSTSHLQHQTNHHNRDYYVSRLIETFQNALSSLGVLSNSCIGDLSLRETDKIESMSNFIYDSMSNAARNYHFVQHVFDLMEGNVCRTRDGEQVLDDIAVLAVLFHDCVYSQVDGGLSASQREKLRGVLVQDESDGSLLRIAPSLDDDPLSRMVLSIFGFQRDQILSPSEGQNEFLSATIAVRELEPLLSTEQLVAIAVAIEATCPFRPPIDGKSAMELLFERLCKAVGDFDLKLSEDDCVRAVQRAAILANEDVGNFGSTDHAWFLDNTWSLLPESNEALRDQDLYTVNHFLVAVYKLHGFFGFLQPELIFQEFRGVPSTTDTLTRHAARNLHVGGKYVSAKLLMISVIAAFAELTGGADVPISLFIGDLPSRKRRAGSLRMESPPQLPPLDASCACPGCLCSHESECCPDVYELLVNGRTRETSFDVRQSPISAYFYSCIGDDGLKRVLSSFQVYPMTRETATKLLAALPRAAVNYVGESMAHLAVSRKQEILDVLHSLPS